MKIFLLKLIKKTLRVLAVLFLVNVLFEYSIRGNQIHQLNFNLIYENESTEIILKDVPIVKKTNNCRVVLIDEIGSFNENNFFQENQSSSKLFSKNDRLCSYVPSNLSKLLVL